MKTTTLSGVQLDYAVALAEGYKFGRPRRLPNAHFYLFPLSIPGQKTLGAVALYSDGWGENVPKFCTGPAGDAIIDRECIDTFYDGPTGRWEARLYVPDEEPWQMFGITRREAAMRCWAAHKLGDEIEIHEVIK